MKKSIIILCVLIASVGVLKSCSKDNDPTDDNVFIGTYKGSVNFAEEENNTLVTTEDGKVTLVKFGDTYNFDFSDGIPSLNGIEMEKSQNVLINSDGTIKIDAGKLIIAYSKDGKVWGANCER
jgi:hypothetical protein